MFRKKCYETAECHKHGEKKVMTLCWFWAWLRRKWSIFKEEMASDMRLAASQMVHFQIGNGQADRALAATVAVPQVLYPQRIQHLLKLEKSPDFGISPQCWIKTASKMSSMGPAQRSPAEHRGLRKWTIPVSKSIISHANWPKFTRKWLIYYWNFATSP